jgi:hypothetical protein
MISHNHEQGSAEWHAARAGVITASMFSTARYKTKKGEWSSEAKNYAFRLALERMGGQPLDDGMETWAMKRGKELEPAARARHAAIIGLEVKPCGFFTTDCGTFGSSPDGLIGDNGCSEYKALVDPSRIGKVLVNGDLSEFMDQIQGHLWITGREWCDFCIYMPQLSSVKRDMFRQRVYVQDQGALVADLHEFNALVVKTQSALDQQLPVQLDREVSPF